MSKTILVRDEDAAVTREAREALQASGFEIRTAVSLDKVLTPPPVMLAATGYVKALLEKISAQATNLVSSLKELEKLEQLKRFFSPQVVDVVSSDAAAAHRRDVTVVFLDLRGFTAFAESAQPDDVTDLLHEYYGTAGDVALEHDATLGKLSGDGMMFFFNDPVEIKNHQEKAVGMTLGLRSALEDLKAKWRKQGHALDYGIGIASGFAMIGRFGFDRYSEYTVIGTVTNLAARLCSEASRGQILIDEYFLVALGEQFETEVIGPMYLKGLPRTVNAYNVLR